MKPQASCRWPGEQSSSTAVARRSLPSAARRSIARMSARTQLLRAGCAQSHRARELAGRAAVGRLRQVLAGHGATLETVYGIRLQARPRRQPPSRIRSSSPAPRRRTEPARPIWRGASRRSCRPRRRCATRRTVVAAGFWIDAQADAGNAFPHRAAGHGRRTRFDRAGAVSRRSPRRTTSTRSNCLRAAANRGPHTAFGERSTRSSCCR